MARRKIDRRYEIVYIKNDGSGTDTVIKIELPFTAEIEIRRDNFASSNVGKVRLYNLARNQRELMRKDFRDFSLRDRLIVRAGYGEELSEIMNMFVSKAFSVRQGVDFVTEIECLDGMYAILNARIDKSYPEGTDIRDMAVDMAKATEEYGLTVGAVGDFPGKLTRGIVQTGNPVELLQSYFGNAEFIDGGVLNIITDNEALLADPVEISPATGLLGTPVRQRQYVNFEMIFEPQVAIGKLVRIQSTTGDSDINQNYIVYSLSHSGMISETKAGSVITQVGCLPGTFTQIAKEEK